MKTDDSLSKGEIEGLNSTATNCESHRFPNKNTVSEEMVNIDSAICDCCGKIGSGFKSQLYVIGFVPIQNPISYGTPANPRCFGRYYGAEDCFICQVCIDTRKSKAVRERKGQQVIANVFLLLGVVGLAAYLFVHFKKPIPHIPSWLPYVSSIGCFLSLLVSGICFADSRRKLPTTSEFFYLVAKSAAKEIAKRRNLFQKYHFPDANVYLWKNPASVTWTDPVGSDRCFKIQGGLQTFPDFKYWLERDTENTDGMGCKWKVIPGSLNDEITCYS